MPITIARKSLNRSLFVSPVQQVATYMPGYKGREEETKFFFFFLKAEEIFQAKGQHVKDTHGMAGKSSWSLFIFLKNSKTEV